MDGVAADEARVIDRWALSRFPFDSASFCPDWPHDSQFAEAEARLEYVLERPGTVGLLSVERGCGERYLLESIRTLLRAQSLTAWWLDAAAANAQQFLASIVDQLDAGPVENGDRLRRLVQDELSSRHQIGHRIVIVADNLHRLTRCGAVELRWLAAAGEPAGVTVIGVTQTPVTDVVREEFLELVDVRMHVGPLAPEETGWYVRHCLSAAGSRGDVFDSGALRGVHDRTGGVLRRINRLCRFALLAALADEADTITADVVDRVAAEIG